MNDLDLCLDFRTDFTDLNLTELKGHCFVLVSGYVC